ncbi:MAG: 50S ribosomal protein L24 [Candidatus Methanomethylophilaceae archaeon]|jgi:large subunit ribosomal protein L24|nr:50S ribosomal protein L24 [Candidatus Methanomethylophilaceae archaeon]
MVSSKARVQRYNQANAPLHVKRKMLSSHLSDDLRKEFGKRSARVCKGDTVMVVRGNEDIRGIEGKVVNVYTQTGRVAIEGVTIKSADGTEKERPIHASNLVIVKLNLDDAWRKEALSRKEAKE